MFGVRGYNGIKRCGGGRQMEHPPGLRTALENYWRHKERLRKCIIRGCLCKWEQGVLYMGIHVNIIRSISISVRNTAKLSGKLGMASCVSRRI
jgi:hypothetical protein